MKLTDFKVLTFDCYGTLIDWEQGMITALAPLTEKLNPKLSRDTILQMHAHYESTLQAQTPTMLYSQLLATVYKRMAEEWNVTVSWQECVHYGQSVKDWPAFEDSSQALAYLKAHYKLVILSNVDNASFAASNEKLGIPFDAVYVAEDIGSYKPADANFEYMTKMLAQRGINKSQVLHVAESLFHDHVPANRHGYKSCWIYRRHDQNGFGATMDPGEVPPVDFRFNSMAELANAHRKS